MFMQFDVEVLEKGILNLEKYFENIQQFNVKLVIVINCFIFDMDEEVQLIKDFVVSKGVVVVVVEVWVKGGEGVFDLVQKVIDIVE